MELAFLEAIPQWKNADQVLDRHSQTVANLKSQVQKLMSSKVAIFKTTASLEAAENELHGYYLAAKELYQTRKLTPQLLELRNLVNVSYLIIKQAQQATENRGVHYNQDYA